MAEKIKIELSKDEALILFDRLARLEEKDSLPSEDHAEEMVFWAIQAQLESALVEPFDPKYRELLKEAKARVSGSE